MRLGRNVSLALILFGWIGMAAPIGYADDVDKVTLQGTGATFPAPLYQRWFSEYNKLHPDRADQLPGARQRRRNQAVPRRPGELRRQRRGHDRRGDRGGQERRRAAADDRRQHRAQLQPPGADRRSSSSLARPTSGIFLGKITQWNDPAIAKANPGAKLPDTKITVVTRSDGSGTTFVFTSHLSADQRGLEEGPRRGQVGELSRRRRGQRKPGRDGARSSRRPARSATSSSATPQQTKMPMAHPGEQERQVREGRPRERARRRSPASSCRPTCAPGCRIPTGPTPTRSSPTPGCSATRSTTIPKISKTLKSVIEFGLTQGQNVQRRARIRPAAGERRHHGQKALGQIS